MWQIISDLVFYGVIYQYKYNGKELQETGMYDYGARFYMPDLGRWGTQDDLSELQLHYSPYSYVYNNPIFFNDPTGMIGESCEGCPDKSKNPEINPNAKGGVNNPINIQEVVITGYKKIQSVFTNIDLNKVATIMAPIRPVTPNEQALIDARYGKADGFMGNLNLMWRQIKDVPSNLADTWESLKSIGENEDKEEVIISTVILLVSLKKGKIGNIAKMGVGKSTSGWVISKVFNSLDTAIQTKIKNAISKGIVAPTGQQGIIKLTATEAAQTGYQYKIKILGK
ncbi:RHS repeat domain-containing protein [Chryseobacterium tongliaoense]|uniref:RHS repeat domain-containing protein n=1 Tax=Chryseobacterium tongliaoense TaxID=3240933 RepID=UPI0035199F4F